MRRAARSTPASAAAGLVSHSNAPNPYAGGDPGGTFVPPEGANLPAGMRQNNMGNIGYFGQRMAGLIGPSGAKDVDHHIARFATQEGRHQGGGPRWRSTNISTACGTRHR